VRISAVNVTDPDLLERVLDNPAWHALTGPQVTVAQRQGDAARYDPAFAPFAALPDDPTAAVWTDLRGLVGPRGIAVLFGPELDVPADVEVLQAGTGVQMVARAVRHEGRPDADAVELGPSDVPQILDLIERTQPGPFAARTVQLGTYLGIRVGRDLVAMAGERMHPPGCTEISAVCTAPGYRGRGYGARLVTELVRRIEARGDTAFLHAVSDNYTAIRLYEWLGFEHRQDMHVSVVRP
jgi:ribosomal protein S18 acetylase RimI-like enzyme